MTTNKTIFGILEDGTEIFLYTLENKNGMKAQMINYGAILVNLYVSNKEGNIDDIVLGYDNLEQYMQNDNFFGATIGPNANRIGGASFSLDGTKYNLVQNNGSNNLHSHSELGFHKKVWDVTMKDQMVTFTTKKEAGEMGFPGNVTASVTYYITDLNELGIIYEANSDENTILNMTNHTYFNLSGHDGPNICNHKMWIKSSAITDILPGAIPTGTYLDVKDTSLDFTTPKMIGDEIDKDYLPTVLTGGYDHNWIIDEWDGTLALIAKLEDPNSGRNMEVYTDLPGVQFYAGNFIDEQIGKGGIKYGPRKGLCLETQYFPDTPNQPDFPSCVFGPNRPYKTTTIYKFK